MSEMTADHALTKQALTVQTAKVKTLELENARLRSEFEAALTTLQLLLDQIDFTAGACSITDMVGACIPPEVFDRCHAAVKALAQRPEG